MVRVTSLVDGYAKRELIISGILRILALASEANGRI
jgi:hypothetical protein